jgi:hypothetical protein
MEAQIPANPPPTTTISDLTELVFIKKSALNIKNPTPTN